MTRTIHRRETAADSYWREKTGWSDRTARSGIWAETALVLALAGFAVIPRIATLLAIWA